MTTWTFRDMTTGERFLCHQSEGESIKDFIEEQMFVLWEMSPVSSDWHKELSSEILWPLFRYGKGEDEAVEINMVSHTVTVLD